MRLFIQTITCLSLISSLSLAEDWPTHLHDNRRSGISTEQLNAASLSQSWVYSANVAPQPAHKGSMARDSYNRIIFSSETFDYDRAFNIIAANDKVFIASSSENSCIALNATDGSTVWRKPVGGAVRIAPTYDSNKVYFGSDDGLVYCVNASNGALVWKYQAAPTTTYITSDHKFLTRFPCRTGVLIQDGSAYCGFALGTWNGSYLAKLNSTTGGEITKTFHRNTKNVPQNNLNFSFEGAMATDGVNLIAPQGRRRPASFNLSDTAFTGIYPGCGATYVTVTAAGKLYHGPAHDRNNRRDYMTQSTAATRGNLVRINSLDRIITNGSNEYKIIQDSVSASGSTTWVQGIKDPSTIIQGGTTIYVGAKKQVLAIDSATGNVLRSLPIEGTAFSLALANGKLFASTTTGKIYCFN